MPRKGKSEGEVGLWHFRVHYGSYLPEEIIAFTKEKADVIIAVRETASRPHIHTVITKFKQTKSTFVQQFLKQFPDIKGNGGYSCEIKKDIEAQIRYCCKGDSMDTLPDVLMFDNSRVDIQEYHDAYWKENMLLKAKSEKDGNMGLQKDTSLVVKAKSKTWTEKVYQELSIYEREISVIQLYQLIINPSDLERKEYMDACFVIYKHMLRCLGKGAKKVNDFIKRDLYNGFINGIISQNDDAFEVYARKDFVNVILSK